jgi:hypothetical protein
MPYISSNYDNNPNAKEGKWVSYLGGEQGQCVSYVKVVTPGLPQTSKWKKGALVRGLATVKAGTVIATFDAKGHYHGHAAIYVSQDEDGILVWDQYITPPNPKPIGSRTLRFGAHGNSNNGDKFYVVD